MEQLKSQIAQVVQELFHASDVPVEFTPAPENVPGDYATNIALRLSKTAGQNPRAIAEQIIAALPEQNLSIAGPGFINVTLPDADITTELSKICTQNNTYGAPETYKDQVVVAEFSDPNPFKVLHIGHLYTSIIGDAISRLVEFAGGQTHRVNFGGDVGLHVAKTIWAIGQDLGGFNYEPLCSIPADQRADWISRCYVAGTRAYDDDPAATAEIIALNRQIYEISSQDLHDSDLAAIYWTCREWSYQYFDDFYAQTGLKFEKYYPESTVADLGLQTVREQAERGVYTESNGAIVFVGEPYGLHTRVFINQNGIPTYEAKDVGLIQQKWADYHFDRSIVVTANEQSDYMKVVLKSVEQFAPELVQRTTHLTHGLVKLQGAQKMSSRKGNFVRAVDVLDIVQGTLAQQIGQADHEVVLAAIKYAFLKNRYQADVIFDPETSVSLQGNSGPYLQYSLIRARAILRKLPDFDPATTTPDNLDPIERPLALKLTQFSATLAQATTELAPHLICTYLYELAQTFSRFYESAKVAGDPRQATRATLVQAYANILAIGLHLLGINTPERM